MEVLYGLHPIEEALRANARRIDYVLLARERSPRLDALAELCRAANVRVSQQTKDQLTKLAGTDAHQGAVAAVRERKLLTLEDLLAAPPRSSHKFLLALDGVEDPHNLGALLRSADGAGIDGVLLPERRTAPISPVVAKTSAGASEHVPIARVTNITRALEQLKTCQHLDHRPRRARHPGLHRLQLPPGLLPRPRSRRRRTPRPRQANLRPPPPHPHARLGRLPQRLRRRCRSHVRSPPPAHPAHPHPRLAKTYQASKRSRLTLM